MSAFACQGAEQEPDPGCEGAKCDSVGDSGDWSPSDCYESATTGAVRCSGQGLEGIAELIQSGFDPILPMQCGEVSVGDPADPGIDDKIMATVIPICDYLPHCFFKESGGYCAEAWQWYEEQEPPVQCGLIDSAPISKTAKEAYCAMSICDYTGECHQACTAYDSAKNGATRCAASGAVGLSALVESGEQPVIPLTCSEISTMAYELGQELGDQFDGDMAMMGICESVPYCFFKESGGYCATAWEWVGNVEPAEQCNMIDGARITESAKEAYCGLPVENACGGSDCKACQWTAGATAAAPGSCTAAAGG